MYHLGLNSYLKPNERIPKAAMRQRAVSLARNIFPSSPIDPPLHDNHTSLPNAIAHLTTTTTTTIYFTTQQLSVSARNCFAKRDGGQRFSRGGGRDARPCREGVRHAEHHPVSCENPRNLPGCGLLVVFCRSHVLIRAVESV